MGLFDSVMVPCPKCTVPVEFQSKALEDPYMNVFTLADAPAPILNDIINNPNYCQHCGQWFALVDPKYPPGEQPKPDLRVLKVKAPANPATHFQGFKWWPRDKPFSWDDLEEPIL